MSYKNQAEIDTVNNLINNLEKGQYLDASGISLCECTMFLSTHRDSGFYITNPLRVQQAQLINAELKEVYEKEYEDKILVTICPTKIHSGMLIFQHGYIGRVVRVDRYENIDLGVVNSSEPYIYSVMMEYVSGDLYMHKYFTSSINNGCAKGYLSTKQGNRLAHFQRVSEESKIKV